MNWTQFSLAQILTTSSKVIRRGSVWNSQAVVASSSMYRNVLAAPLKRVLTRPLLDEKKE